MKSYLCENGSILTWDDENKIVLMQANVSDRCYVYFDKKPILADLCSGKTLAECITIHVYTGIDGENGLYFHDGNGTYGLLEAGDNSYRYNTNEITDGITYIEIVNPDNYIYFGSDSGTCQEENLYRIIGVFDGQVKLVKNTSIGKYLRDETTESWETSSLNSFLNEDYYNSLPVTFQNLISNNEWKIGGMNVSDSIEQSASMTYDYEVGDNSIDKTYNAKIGLMYVSDYGYAADPDFWDYVMSDYLAARDYNWMSIGISEWTISYARDYGAIFTLLTNGDVNLSSISNSLDVRPSFYLQPWVLYSSGDGTIENTYRLSVT